MRHACGQFTDHCQIFRLYQFLPGADKLCHLSINNLYDEPGHQNYQPDKDNPDEAVAAGIAEQISFLPEKAEDENPRNGGIGQKVSAGGAEKGKSAENQQEVVDVEVC